MEFTINIYTYAIYGTQPKHQERPSLSHVVCCRQHVGFGIIISCLACAKFAEYDDAGWKAFKEVFFVTII